MAKEKCKNYPYKCKSWGPVNYTGLCPACRRHQHRQALLECIKIDVLELHNNPGIMSRLEHWREQGASYELIAKAIGKGVTSQDVRRSLGGKTLRSKRKQRLFGQPVLIDVPACPDCDLPQAHVHEHDEQAYNPKTHRTAAKPGQVQPWKPGRDLFGMGQDELLWRLANRETIA